MSLINKNFFLKEKIIKINKVSKSNKGFSSISYSVLAIVGDGNGGLGFGKSKGKDQNTGILKAIIKAKSKFFRTPLKNGSIYHEIIGKHGSSMVILIPTRYGTEVLAGGCIRFIFDVMGITNIIAKTYGSTNPYNITLATINALINLSSPLEISKKRGKSFKDIY